jgi:sodium transport system permease protein
MRWSIIRLIWLRELRDQLRDRRTVFMIAVLPVLLYPAMGFGVLRLVAGFVNQTHIVGIVGAEHLVPWEVQPDPSSLSAGLTITPAPPGAPLAGVASLISAAAFDRVDPRRSYPPLIVAETEGESPRLVFNAPYSDLKLKRALVLRRLAPLPNGPASDSEADVRKFLKDIPQTALARRHVDLIVVVPPGFQRSLLESGRPTLYFLTREGDDTSRLVNGRVSGVLARWRRDLKEIKLIRRGLAPDFDEPFRLYDPERNKSPARLEEEGLSSMLVRIFPFILVMWSLAGALYPAVDLCAGEKERGTMETLLISPAAREEIVLGKFLTIWVFSAGTALLNLFSMGLTFSLAGSALPEANLGPAAAFWAVVLLLPLSAFFSALCLSVGAYARSSKEGQYYLMPLFLVTMPLIFLTLAPGVELNPFYSMVPVTGVALLLQKLMTAGTPDWGLWFYFVPVLVPMLVYSWLALRWAIAQFHREEVLFREAERLDIGLWLRRLLREKEPLPSAGEAIVCFGLILGLHWLSFNVGTHLSLLARTGVSHLAFVATPPLFMALLLTTRPLRGLALRLPPWWAWPAAVVLAVLVLPPLAELTLSILWQFPALRTALELHHPLPGELRALDRNALLEAWQQGDYFPVIEQVGRYFFVLALLPALCEEIAFRGFILTGLLRSFRPWTAVVVSSLLFALYQLNVFQAVPHFVFGVVLGLLVVRSGSVLPGMLFHLVYNSLLIGPALLPGLFEGLGPEQDGLPGSPALRLWLALVCAALAGGVLAGLWRFGRERPPVFPKEEDLLLFRQGER